jgi:hypothetical protein
MGRHHGIDWSAEGYGKHSYANGGDLSVAQLVQRIVSCGGAIRLDWRATDAHGLVDGDGGWWPVGQGLGEGEG